jgi:hypothetical protein
MHVAPAGIEGASDGAHVVSPAEATSTNTNGNILCNFRKGFSFNTYHADLARRVAGPDPQRNCNDLQQGHLTTVIWVSQTR